MKVAVLKYKSTSKKLQSSNADCKAFGVQGPLGVFIQFALLKKKKHITLRNKNTHPAIHNSIYNW